MGVWHGWAPSVYLADLEKAGVELKDKVKDSRRVEDLDREVREWGIRFTLLLPDGGNRATVIEPELRFNREGFVWVDVHSGKEYSFSDIEELLAKGYYRERDVVDVLREAVSKSWTAVRDGARYVVVCPECHDVGDGSGWITWSNNYYGERSVLFQSDCSVDVVDKELEDYEMLAVTHVACGFMSEMFSIDEFAVLIRGNVVLEAGTYWRYNPDDLRKIAEEKGWVLSKEVVKELKLSSLSKQTV